MGETLVRPWRRDEERMIKKNFNKITCVFGLNRVLPLALMGIVAVLAIGMPRREPRPFPSTIAYVSVGALVIVY